MEELLREILSELRDINTKLGTKTADALPDVITVDDIVSYLNIGRNKAHEILNDKSFTALKYGRKKCIYKSQFLAWYEKDVRRKMLVHQ